MSTASPPQSQSPQTPSSSSNATKLYSCILCKQRKVKCDRVNPCSNCTKARAECIFRAPPPPRRKKRAEKARELGMRERLQRYEGLLRGMGVSLDEVGSGGVEETRIRSDGGRGKIEDVAMREAGSPEAETGRLVSERGKSRYLENNLWTSVTDELQDANNVLQESSEDEETELPAETPSYGLSPDGGDLVLGAYSSHVNLHVIHPEPMHIFRLWQTFLDNVNPLTKLFHIPTMQKEIFDASANLDSISKRMEAVMFAIYSTAVASLNQEQCEAMIGEKKSILQAKYQFATRQALLKAEFLKSSDLGVLQAYVLFLLAVRQSYDSRSLWTLTGIAIRIGQRIGLHRDGTTLGLRPFDIEIRRRVWWQILLIDGRAAELAGSGVSVLHHLSDTKVPLNVNDSDLHPDMKDPPIEHAGRATEMIFCLIRYEFGEFLLNSNFKNAFDGNWQRVSNLDGSLAEKDKALDELERILEHKFLRYCDPQIPLHFLSAGVARAALSRMRLVAHHPRQYSARGLPIPKADSDLLFTNSLKMIEFDNLGHATKTMQRFLWHGAAHFQWHALIYLLSALRTRTAGSDVGGAWEQVDELFANHPQLSSETKKSLPIAIGTLALKAYEARDAELARRRQGVPQGWPPRFISALTARRGSLMTASARNPVPSSGNHTSTEYMPEAPHFPSQPKNDDPRGFDPTFLTDPLVFGQNPMDPIDWAQWDNLLQDFQWQNADSLDPL